MKPGRSVTHKFVQAIPDTLDEATIYVALEYGTVVHKCFCGCGHEVVTPLSPTDWRLIYDGETISLSPSIGSWGLPCQSHYWIVENKVVWSPKLSERRIQQIRDADRAIKNDYYAGKPLLGLRGVYLPKVDGGPSEEDKNNNEADEE